MARRRIGFVGSGGATKALYFHYGAALALEEFGFKFIGGLKSEFNGKLDDMSIDTLVGSSAGSISGAEIASGHKIRDLIEKALKNTFYRRTIGRLSDKIKHKKGYEAPSYLEMLEPNWRLPMDYARGLADSFSFRKITPEAILHMVLANSLLTTKGIERYVREKVVVSNNFNELAADLFIIATQLNGEKKVVFGPKRLYRDDDTKYATYASISDAVAASCCLPGLFVPYRIKDEKGRMIPYIDGEIRNTLSKHVAKDNNCDLIIASYTHQPYKYDKRSLYYYGVIVQFIQAVYLNIEQKIGHSMKVHELRVKAIESVRKSLKGRLKEGTIEDVVMKLRKDIGYKKDTNYMLIMPRKKDNFFFEDHFNLSPSYAKRVIEYGYARAKEALEKNNKLI